VYDRKIVTVTEDTTAKEALNAMHDAGTSCALLYANDGALMGVLDTPDVVRHVLRATTLVSHTAVRLLRQCVVASDAMTLNDVFKHLRNGTRYVAIASSSGGHQIVSQRSLVQAVLDAANENTTILEILSNTLCTAGIASFGRVVHVDDTACARHAFELMAAYGVTSLPICDPNGRVCGVISATDVLYARHDSSTLDTNVVHFVRGSRKDAMNDRPVNCVVSCRAEDTFMIALRTMLHHHVHHVYVLTSDDEAMGVVSFVDILRRL